MIATLASLTVLAAGIYFIGLAFVAFWAPDRAGRFLRGFATSARAHYLELSLRLALGAAFLAAGRRMLFPEVFVTFGWILVLTTAVLLLIPWQWHARFAQKSVPHAVRHLRLVAVASLALGSSIIAAVANGAAP